MAKPFENTSILIQQAISTKKIEQKSGAGIQIKESKSTDKKDILMSFLYGMYLINMLEREMIFEEKTTDYSRMAFTATKNNSNYVPAGSNRTFGGLGSFGGFGNNGTYRSFFN